MSGLAGAAPTDADDGALHRLVGRASIAGAGMLYQQGISFVSGLMVARVLGAADFGVLNLARQLADLAGILSRLGLDLGLQRHMGENGPAGAALLTRLRAVAAAVALLPAAAAAAGLGALLGRTVYPHPHFAELLVGLLVALPFLTDVSVLGGAYRGVLRLAPAVFAESVLLPTVKLAAIALLFLAGWRLGAVVAGSLLAAVVAALVLGAAARRDFRRAAAGAHAAWPQVRRVAGYSAVLSAAVLVTALTSNLDLLLLGHFESAAETGRYALAKTLLLIMSFCAVAFGQGLGALVARRYAQGDAAGMAALIATTARWIALGTLPLYALFLYWGPELTTLFGPDFRASAPVMAWLATGQYCVAVLGPAGWALSMTGRHKAEFVILCAGVLLCAALGWWAIPRFGAPGAAAAAAAGVVAANVARLCLARRVAGRWPLGASLAGLTLLGLALAGGCELLSGALPWPETWRAAAAAASFLAAWVAVVWAGVLDDAERAQLRRALQAAGRRRAAGEAR